MAFSTNSMSLQISIYICISTPTSPLNHLLSIRKSDRHLKLTSSRKNSFTNLVVPGNRCSILPVAEVKKYQALSFSGISSPMH